MKKREMIEMETENPRIMRGLAIAAQAECVERKDNQTFQVKAQSGNGSYVVSKQGAEWTCTCPDYCNRRADCKHIHAVRMGLAMGDSLEIFETYKQMQESSKCRYCGSENIEKYGVRDTTRDKKQIQKCKDCGRKFTADNGFGKMKAEPEVITVALDLYFKGISLRKVVDHLNQFYSIKLCHTTVLRWISKYAEVVNAYVEDLRPDLSEMWHADEMMIRCGGRWSWLWNLMDKETRFLLANLISKTREINEAKRLFHEAKMKAGKRPETIVTDGLQGYREAYMKEFRTQKSPRTEHVRLRRFEDKVNNNLVERLQGTIREREKVMRGLQTEETAKTMMDGLKDYYNFLRPHMGLENKTPAQAANIELELGRNRWQSIIRQSSAQPEHTTPKIPTT